jgi:hypothetical protein
MTQHENLKQFAGRRKFLITTASIAGILFSKDAMAQNNLRLSSEQRQTLDQMVAILSGAHVPNTNIDEELQKTNCSRNKTNSRPDFDRTTRCF